MTFIEDTVEKHIKNLEKDNLTIDTSSLEMIISDLEEKVKTLYVITNPYY